ncbi:hypothetical protein QTP88_027443 [Uroleucon formosanum]
MQLRDILISLPGQLKLPFDVNAISLYELSKTSKLAIVYMNGTLVFELIIPLLNPVELTLYHMIPLPVRREKLYMHLTPEFEYMAISKTHEYYLTISVTHLMKCRELTSITMCPETQPLRIGSAGLPCEVELFMKPTVVPATCTVKYLEITRSIYHKLKYHNKWIYIINTLDDVAVTCDQSDNAKNIQLRGVGILTLSEQCRAHTPQVVLTPSRHLKSVQYLDFIPPVNIPNVKIPLVPSFKFDNLLNHQTSIIKLNHISDFSKTIEELENAVQDEKNRIILQTTSDHLTKFCILNPLTSKRAEQVARVLLDIFCLFGAPASLQSDNGREFCNELINSLREMWPNLNSCMQKRLVVECDRGAAYWSESECAVDGFGFIEFEPPFFVPCREDVKVSLDSAGCLERVMVESQDGFIIGEVTVGAPCGTPALIDDMSDRAEPYRTEKCLSSRYDLKIK